MRGLQAAAREVAFPGKPPAAPQLQRPLVRQPLQELQAWTRVPYAPPVRLLVRTVPLPSPQGWGPVCGTPQGSQADHSAFP